MNYAGDLLLSVKQHGSLSYCGTAKQLEGSCRFVQARQKKRFIKILSSKTTIFSVVWFMDLVEDCVQLVGVSIGGWW